MQKTNKCIFNDIKNIFDVYNMYKFKLENIELLNKTNLSIDDDKLELVVSFIKLIDVILDYLPEEDSKMIKMIFIKKKHYTEFSCSQSSYFSKRKSACLKFHKLLLTANKINQLEEFIYSLKLN